MKEISKNTVSRRTALTGAGVAGLAGAVAAVMPGSDPVKAADAMQTSDSAPGTDDGGYRLTEHIKRYYSTART